MRIFYFLRDWSEVWALLIPLIVILFFKPKGKKVRLLILYVLIALVLNFMAIFVVEYYDLVPSWVLNGNNIFYNLHEFFRTILFSWYLIYAGRYKYPAALKILPLIYLVFVPLNFIISGSPVLLNPYHFAAGITLLLILCIYYFISSIRDEKDVDQLNEPAFIICAGLALYEAATFFYFVFLFEIFKSNQQLGFVTNRVYQVAFIVFCTLLAIGLYKYRKRKIKVA